MIHGFNKTSQFAAVFYHKTCAEDASQTNKLRDESGQLRQKYRYDYNSDVMRAAFVCWGDGLVSVDTVLILWHGDNLSTLHCMVEEQVAL